MAINVNEKILINLKVELSRNDHYEITKLAKLQGISKQDLLGRLCKRYLKECEAEPIELSA